MPYLEFKSITKRFPGVLALDGVGFTIEKGTCHALIGENGAGKSTLGKILAGVHTADSGEIKLDGKVIHPTSPLHARELGIAMVHQELAFCPNLSVAENLCLGDMPRRAGFVNRKELRERARAMLATIGADIDPDVIIGTLSTGREQLVQIAAAVGTGAQVITKYRARTHEAMLLYWGPDFMDPHSNAKAFAYNADNSDDKYASTTTWRNAWAVPEELNKETMAALAEPDAAKRDAMYVDLQKKIQAKAPFVIMFQAVKHQLANLAVEIEPTRALYWYAAHALDHIPEQGPRSAAVAKAHICDVAMQVARDSVELHGGIGFTWECDVQLWFKRVMFDRAFLGAPSLHRARAALLAGW